MPSWDKDDTNVKIDKIWTLYVEDPRNRIPAVDVFASGAQFKLRLSDSGTYTVIPTGRGMPPRWSPCELTEVGTDWQSVIPETYAPYVPGVDTFLKESRIRYRQLSGAARCLVGSLQDQQEKFYCDIKLFQVPNQLIDSSEIRHDLLILWVVVPYGRHLNCGSGYGHS